MYESWYVCRIGAILNQTRFVAVQHCKEHPECLNKFSFTVAAARDGEQVNKI